MQGLKNFVAEVEEDKALNRLSNRKDFDREID